MWKSFKRYKELLLFKDYLRKHPREAKRYYLLKKLWAKKAGSEPRKFTELKKIMFIKF